MPQSQRIALLNLHLLMHTCVFECADSKCLKWLKTRLVTPNENAALIKIITIKVVTGSLHGLKLSSFTFNIRDT